MKGTDITPYKSKEDKKEYDKKYRIRNKDERKKQAKEYYQNNSERIKQRSEQWSKDNPDKKKNIQRRYRKNNPDKIREYFKQYRKDNREKCLKYSKKWRENNSEKITEYQKYNPEKAKLYLRQWKKDNPEKGSAYSRKWRRDNLEKEKERCRQKMSYSRKTDLKFNLNDKMRQAIALSLKGNKAGRHWEDLVGYTLEDLIKRLKKTMPEGYTWQDFMEGRLHIDHIIPISAFNYTKPEHLDFKRCWALSNLRLLPAKENMVKHNKLIKPFQPSLKISI